jgi:hypothetical protein
MLATPTGSTAYSVAAGGSMVHPNVPAMLLTPVCPHSLNFRPIILPDYIELELRVPRNARSGAWVCFDGKARQELFRGDAVLIKVGAAGGAGGGGTGQGAAAASCHWRPGCLAPSRACPSLHRTPLAHAPRR